MEDIGFIDHAKYIEYNILLRAVTKSHLFNFCILHEFLMQIKLYECRKGDFI